MYRVVDQSLNVLGGLGTPLGELTHFCPHDSPPSFCASACRLHGGMEGQEIGLESDAVNDTDDIGHLHIAGVDRRHSLNGAPHNLALSLERNFTGR